MLNKPAYIGMCILELSKVLMCEFHYVWIPLFHYRLDYPTLKIKTFKYDVYRCFNDLPLDLRKEISNNKFISGAKSFFINKAFARLS